MKKENKKNDLNDNDFDNIFNNEDDFENDLTNEPKKKKMNPLKVFLLVVGATVGVFILVTAVAVFGYLAVSPGSNGTQKPGELIVLEDGTVTSKPVDNSFLDELFMPPERTNIVVMGVDKTQSLADVVIVGTFYRDTQKIDLISIPRDTRVEFTSEERAELNKAGRKAPDVVKLTEVHSYAGKDIAQEFTKKVVARLLGIEIDYFVEVNINAFRQIVDTVGGIEMDLPSQGFHYSDPEQDLYINVPGGHQKLTGEMAEGVVRYRDSYARGDLQRIEVQQEFMRQFFRQVLNKQTIINNALGFVTTIIKYVKTDFPLTEAPKYIKYINDLSPDKFDAHTVPGSAENSKYFEIYEKEKEALISEIFNSQVMSAASQPSEPPSDSSGSQASASPSSSPSGTPPVLASSKEMRLKVLNGAGISGIAAAYNELLTSEGFNVVEYDTYEGTRQKPTRIMVRESGLGEDLKTYFVETVIEIDKDMPAEVDIVIIIGSGESKP